MDAKMLVSVKLTVISLQFLAFLHLSYQRFFVCLSNVGDCQSLGATQL